MSNFMAFPVVSFIFITLLVIVYFCKPRLNSKENKIYKFLLVSNVLGLILEIFCHIAVNIADTHYILSMFILKSYVVYLFVWTMIFNIYVFLVTSWRHEKKDQGLEKYYKKLKKISIFIIGIVSTIIYILPIKIFNSNGIVYSYGVSVNFLIVICFIIGFIWVIKCLKNIKSIRQKKYIPIFACIIVLVIIASIQSIDRSFLIATTGHSLICFLMFFTIENPDLKMLSELELAKDMAEKSNRAKSDFLSSMSHEIRTPLNAIMGLSELNKDAETLEESKENSKDIISAANVLHDIVGNVLDMSKIESGSVEINEKEYDPHEMFENAINLVEYRYQEKGITLNTYIAPDLPNRLFGGKSSLTKVIINLLTNAVKYTSEGHVNLTVHSVDKNNISRLIISVEDTGRGIKPEQIDKLFVRFSRLDEDRNTTIEGTGLGLAITKHILDLMGGHITVQSVYGSGSKFTVVVNQKIVDNSKKQTMETNNNSVDLNLKDKKIFLIDDNQLNLKVAERILGKYYCDVVCVSSGKECLDKINQGEKFDLLLMDEMMPEMSGTECMQTLKQKGYKVPIAVLTADVEANSREKFINAGFDDYLAKPIELKELERVLKKFVQ
ncbi:MAG: ATP-binding protein [Bacilli bacterium]